jgi:hypothetical protein
METELKQEECQKLKNIKFKHMLLTGNTTPQTPASKKANIDLFLEKEMNLNKHESCNKIDKTGKIKLLTDYVNLSAVNFSLNETEISEFKNYLIDSLDKKKLQHVKDVQYDNQNGKIILIPNLNFNVATRKFTFKRNEKRASTVKSLGSGKKTPSKKSAAATCAATPAATPAAVPAAVPAATLVPATLAENKTEDS